MKDSQDGELARTLHFVAIQGRKTMKTHIFVATDGSETAAMAVELAAELAAKFDVPLTVGHVLLHGVPTWELSRLAEAEHLIEHAVTTSGLYFENVPGTMQNLFAESLTAADAARLVTRIGDEIVARAVDRARELGVKTVSSRVVNDDYTDGIVEMAGDAGADMIVMGRRGLGRLQSLFQGSVSQKVSQRAECTVLIVR
jgi:nucleotide-binding universal stress UspA family protein